MAHMYFMAIVLPAVLDEKIRPMKQRLFDAYRCRTGLKSPAHITLVPPFWMQPANEQAIKEAMDDLGREVAPFPLATDGFDAFPPRTLFIAVAPSEALEELKKRSDTHWKGYAQLGIRTDSRPFHPHITLATRDLQRAHFFEAWPQLEGKEWKESWTADALSLLKHNGSCWEVVHEAPFTKVQA